jgi:parvulin-like peptidyl-prolyl cis-trans isomerase-like protein
MRLKRLLAEPMLHFMVMGLVLFAVYRWKSPPDLGGRRIVITQGVVDDLVTQHVAARGREPSDVELRTLIDAYVRDDILYREGSALGLDRDDVVVKRRVRQKLELIGEEEAAATAPTDAELSTYLAANRTRFTSPAIVTFEQVFLGPLAAGQAAAVRAVALTRDGSERRIDPTTLARPTLLPQAMARSESTLIARSFGPKFAAALEQAPLGEWSGPIESAYGTHYVRVSERTPAVMPQLADVRDQVVREWENERRVRARDASYATMRRAYHVSIEAKLPGQRP